MNKDTLQKNNIPDDSNLAQCEDCGYIMDWDDVPRTIVSYVFNDPIEYCPECHSCDCIASYKPEKSLWRKRQCIEANNCSN